MTQKLTNYYYYFISLKLFNFKDDIRVKTQKRNIYYNINIISYVIFKKYKTEKSEFSFNPFSQKAHI